MPALNLATEVSGVSTAGQIYSLTCNVTEIIDGLTGSPAVEWLSSPVAMMDLGVDVSGTSASRRITFNPLQTSLGNEYTCRATLDSPAVEGGTITATDTQTVIVDSKLLNCNTFGICQSGDTILIHTVLIMHPLLSSPCSWCECGGSPRTSLHWYQPLPHL